MTKNVPKTRKMLRKVELREIFEKQRKLFMLYKFEISDRRLCAWSEFYI